MYKLLICSDNLFEKEKKTGWESGMDWLASRQIDIVFFQEVIIIPLIGGFMIWNAF